MKVRSIISNIIWSTISLIISTAITMIILPFVSNRIGIEAYGFISLCNNIITYIDLFASAINVYAVKYISIEYHKGNIYKANSYFSSILIANIIICFVMIVPSTICVAYLNKILNIPDLLVLDVKILFFLTIINYFVTIIGTVFSSAAFIKDMLYKDTRVRAEGNIIRGGCLVILFCFFYPHVWYVSIATICCSFYILIININITKKYIPDIKPTAKTFSLLAIKQIVSNGIWNSVASLGTILNSGLDMIVTNFYLGAVRMGQLSVPKTLSAFISTFLTAMVNSFRPQLLVYYSHEETEKLVDGFKTSMKFCGLITATIVGVFFAFGENFLAIWIPNQDTKLIFELTMLTFIAETFTGFVRPLHYGCVLTGKLKIPCIANLLVGFFNVVGMLFFLNTTNGGLYVVTITTVIGNITYNFIIMPIYVTRILHINRDNIYESILRYVISTVIMTLILFLLFRNVKINGWISMLYWLFISVLLAVCLYYLVMLNVNDKKEVNRIVKGFIKKTIRF